MSHLHARFLPALVALSSISVMVLTGCGAATSFSNPTASAKVHGKIFGGQQPVSGATVTVWAAGVVTYGSPATPLATTMSQSDGSFTIDTPYTCTAGEQVYITAAGGTSVPASGTNSNIMLATGLGDCTAAQTAEVQINEVTTAVTAFALAQFFTPNLGALSTDDFGTDPADLTAFTNSNQYLIPTLIDLPTGTVKPNTPGITIEAAKIYSIADTLASCINDAAGFANCNTLFTDTTNGVRGATVPTDTLQAAVQMARFPYRNVKGLYQLASSKPPFIGLSTQPNDWTIGVSYTSSNYALGIAGSATSATSASIDIDASGKVWFASNLPGATGVAAFDPTTAGFEGPYLAGAYVQPQYVAIDTNGYVWMTDNGSTLLAYTDTTDPDGPNTNGGTFASGTSGPLGGDAMGYMNLAYFDPANGPYLFALSYLLTDATEYTPFTAPPTGLAATFDYVIATESGSSTPCTFELVDFSGDTPSPFATTTGTCNGGGAALASGSEPGGAEDALGMATSVNEFCFADAGACGGPPSDFAADVNLPEGVATDGYGNEWIANSGNASVFTFSGVNNNYANTSPVAYVHDTNNGSTMTTPYALAIDGSGDVWVANAGCVTTTATLCTPGAFVLSEIIGAAGPTITPLSSQMVDDGALVGTPPTAPVPESAAHPHRVVANRLVQKAHAHVIEAPGAAPSSKGTGKPMVLKPFNR